MWFCSGGGGSASVHAGIPPSPGKEAPPPGRKHPPRKEAPLEGSTPAQEGSTPPGKEVTPLRRKHSPREGSTPPWEGITPPPPPEKEAPPPGRKHPPAYGQWAGGTHPTGMHSCYFVSHSDLCILLVSVPFFTAFPHMNQDQPIVICLKVVTPKPNSYHNHVNKVNTTTISVR